MAKKIKRKKYQLGVVGNTPINPSALAPGLKNTGSRNLRALTGREKLEDAMRAAGMEVPTRSTYNEILNQSRGNVTNWRGMNAPNAEGQPIVDDRRVGPGSGKGSKPGTKTQPEKPAPYSTRQAVEAEKAVGKKTDTSKIGKYDRDYTFGDITDRANRFANPKPEERRYAFNPGINDPAGNRINYDPGKRFSPDDITTRREEGTMLKKPEAEGPAPGSYEYALGRSDGKLNEWIKKRGKKGSADYNKYQNLINKAYGKGPTNRPETPKATKTFIEDDKTLDFTSADLLKTDSPGPRAKTPTSRVGKDLKPIQKRRAGGRTKHQVGDFVKTAAKAAGAVKKAITKGDKKDIAKEVAEQKELWAAKKTGNIAKKAIGKKFGTTAQSEQATTVPAPPLKMSKTIKTIASKKKLRDAEKAATAATARKRAGGMKDVPAGGKGKGLSKLPTSVRNKMGFKKHGGKAKKMYGGMKDRRK